MKLLIIGNGFDKKCKLNSSFKDYFESSITNKIDFGFLTGRISASSIRGFIVANKKNLSSMNIIDILLMNAYYDKDPLWSDVEMYIFHLVYQKSDSNGLLVNSYWENLRIILNREIYSYDHLINNKDILTTALDKDKFILMTMIYYSLLDQEKTESPDSWVRFLNKEVHRFEDNFKEYLYAQSENNELYKNNSIKLYDFFFSTIGQGLDIHSNFRVLSFNYTDAPSPYDSVTTYVHGKLSHNRIIIGIDSSKFDYNQHGYLFSKTYKKVEQLLLPSKKNQFDIMENKYSHIMFFGHSLNEQDYSYFQTIFDKFDLYNSSIALTFYYSFYEGKEKNDIEMDQVKAITKLIESYGKTLNNKYQGKNLLHRMINQNRINIIFLPDIDTLQFITK
ncbi:bacteriophage abortive infection AbiH family protein [Paracholeplasma manati]|uniref:Bacteriophage abortive infection AbiH family protein n=1 Tax=Paracholeplasma manati TaxID=591373 RepID=A0ABT2YBN0_9MOLU|nr:bacteriophage abortive infection AbiH family protein [Paracholeplasma manati]MCV2231933.1 bacteriophage abortive infection AbiH family protein [Paracholeplasma manati]MDG0888914.1 bacteriophage abortive infection AbiH family protein [Paracholeplasma manati]